MLRLVPEWNEIESEFQTYDMYIKTLSDEYWMWALEKSELVDY